MLSGKLEPTPNLLYVEGLIPGTSGYELRVAGIQIDGCVGEYSYPLMITTDPSGKQTPMYTKQLSACRA